MTIAELKARKKELGYTNEQVAELSGIPLSTVQKVLGGTTANPRRETLEALEEALSAGHDESVEADGSEQRARGRGFVYDKYHLPYDYRLQETRLAYLIDDDEEIADFRNPGEYTVEDYYRVPDDVRVELIDGRFYMKAAPTANHQYIATAVVTQLVNWQMAHGKTCLAVVSPVDVQLDEDDRTMLQPDLVVVCDRNKHRKGIIYGAPDLVMEVISPSSGGKDRILKFNKYWRAGVKEYWIIDPFEERVTVYFFAAGKPPEEYSFEDQIPVGLTGGELAIDFSVITEFGRRFFDGQ